MKVEFKGGYIPWHLNSLVVGERYIIKGNKLIDGEDKIEINAEEMARHFKPIYEQ